MTGSIPNLQPKTPNCVGLACPTTFVTITGQTCVLFLMRTIQPALSLALVSGKQVGSALRLLILRL